MDVDTEGGIICCLPPERVSDDVLVVAAAAAAGGVAVRELSSADSDVDVELVRLTVPAAVAAGFGHKGMAVKEDSRV